MFWENNLLGREARENRMASNICTICIHPQHAAINDALSIGSPLIPTAAQYGISKSALHRHKINCLAPKLAAAARMVQPTKALKAPVTRAKAIAAGTVQPNIDDFLDLTALLERLARSLERLENGAISASNDNLHAAHAGLAAQLHRGIESVGKLRGYYSDAAQAVQQDKFSIQINLGQHDTPSGSRIIDGSAVRVPEASAPTTPALPHIPSKDFGIQFGGLDAVLDAGIHDVSDLDSLDDVLEAVEGLTED
jgi:hypothetical protein